MPTNSAAWLIGKRKPLRVNAAPYATPGEGQIVLRTYAVGINPYDWIVQCVPGMVCPWLKLPAVLGSDVAGEVVAVGSAVTRFQVGDRVLGHATGTDKSRNTSLEGAFQAYVMVLERMAAPIPPGISFEDASVLPLGLSTAACGLFQKDQLALQSPSKHPVTTEKTLLIWGGSTSVGSNAIQLAVAAGYEVITTASPDNFAYVKELGATMVYNYKDPAIVAQLVQVLRGKQLAGALAIGVGSAVPCLRVARARGSKTTVSIASFPFQFNRVAEGAGLVGELLRQTPACLCFASELLHARLCGIRASFIYGTSLMHNEVSHLIYRDFLPEALAEGRYRTAPPRSWLAEVSPPCRPPWRGSGEGFLRRRSSCQYRHRIAVLTPNR